MGKARRKRKSSVSEGEKSGEEKEGAKMKSRSKSRSPSGSRDRSIEKSPTKGEGADDGRHKHSSKKDGKKKVDKGKPENDEKPKEQRPKREKRRSRRDSKKETSPEKKKSTEEHVNNKEEETEEGELPKEKEEGDDKNENEVNEEKEKVENEAKKDEGSPEKEAESKNSTEGKENQEGDRRTRKRRWGASAIPRSGKAAFKVSSDLLKPILPDVKPLPASEVRLDDTVRTPEREKVTNEEKESLSPKKERRVTVTTEDQENDEVPMIGRQVSLMDNVEERPEREKRRERDRERERERNKERERNRRRSSPQPRRARPPPNQVLFIKNLVRPFTNIQLKELLQRTGRIVDNCFWLDKIKSKCYVKFETIDQADETRQALDMVRWPVNNPKELRVSFSNDEELQRHMEMVEPRRNIETTYPYDDRNYIYDSQRRVGAPVREWDLEKIGETSPGEKERAREREREERERERMRAERQRRESFSRSRSRSRDRLRREKRRRKEDTPAKMLDDLFRKTKSTPCIYWLPLTPQQIAMKEEQRRQRMLERDRRLAEIQKENDRHRRRSRSGTPPRRRR